MPLSGATFDELTSEELLEFLTAELRAEFGEDIDLTQSSAFRTFTEALSTVNAEEIQPALRDVHRAGFLETAEGENLERLVSILGISRRDAVHATGVIEFDHGEVATSTNTITNGTVVQTDGSNPVEFETTELVTISPFDDFESGTLDSDYANDIGDFSVVDGSAGGDPMPFEDSYELKSAAVSGSLIYDDSEVVSRGSKFTFHTYLQNDTATAAAAANCFAVRGANTYYRVKIDSGGEHAIEIVTSSGVTTLQNDTGVTPSSDEWLRNEVDWEGEDNGRIISRVYDSTDTLISEIEVTNEDEIDAGGFGFQSLDGSENKYWDLSGETEVQANARCTEGGTVGNVGANTLTVMPFVPSGVSSVTNPWPMGDSSHRLTNTIQFSTGRATESDEELRERASVSEGARGEATVPALLAELTALPDAVSISVYENKTNTDNTGSGGLPPKSFEVVYYGDDPNQMIADTIFNTKGFTARDYGGAHGTEVTETVEAENGQQFTMHWSSPTEIDVDMTLDVVVNDEFIGEDELQDRIVDYIGGTASDGTTTLGIGTGEDVYVDQVEDVVTGPDDTGVIGISSYSFTPAVTTDGNGLEVVAIGSDETAVTNAQDGSITLNITRI